MKVSPESSIGGRAPRRTLHVATLGVVVLALSFILSVASASAAKQAVDFFGSEGGTGVLGGQFDEPRGIAVNNSGAGPADKGDIYVVDARNNRIQRFGRNDSSTPADPSDDTYSFISAWGAGVDSAVGGSGYQICVVASKCQAGLSSGSNGALGSVFHPLIGDEHASGVAVDQDSGEVYVSDAANFRINVYAGDGPFLRSFGYDVVASGPGQVSGPNEQQQLAVKAGGGKFSLSFNGASTGPTGRGARDTSTTVITNFEATAGTFAVGQSISGQGIVPGTTITQVGATTLRLSQPPTVSTEPAVPLFVDNFPHNASAAEVEASLDALPSIGGVGGAVTVAGGPGDESGSTPYTIDFGGTLAGDDLSQIIPTQGGLTVGSGSASAIVTTLADGGAYEVCVAAAGDICKAGSPGAHAGEVGGGVRGAAPSIAVSQPDGNPATGSVFLADAGNHRVNTYGLDGSSPSSFGSETFAVSSFGVPSPVGIAVDSRGIVYASNSPNSASAGEIERYDTENANGGGVGFLAPILTPPLSGEIPTGRTTLAVEPDTDAGGPDTDVLYSQGSKVFGPGESTLTVQQFGPLNAPGLTAPPTAIDDEHGTTSKLSTERIGIAFDESDGRLYLTFSGDFSRPVNGVYILDNPSPPPTATLDSLSDVTATTVTVHATINPNGPPATSYHLEYSTDGTSWKSGPDVLLGSQKTPQPVEATLDPPGGGLEPETLYHVRLVAKRPLLDAIVTSELTFTTLGAIPAVETTGSPVRTATTARLDSRVDPRGASTSYYFEYGDQGPCDANPCTATEAHAAGSGREAGLVSQQVTGLEPATTYHYRVVVENSNSGSPVSGGDMTLTTFSSDAPLTHGHLPGPPGSDRAWEQVNQPDTGGNQVFGALGYSEDGSRASFRIAGGTPDSQTGSLFAFFFSERSPTGWQVKQITPPRSELIGADWEGTTGSNDLSSIVSANTEFTKGEAVVWRFDPTGQPEKLYQRVEPQEYQRGIIGVSADGTRTVVAVRGSADPGYPEAAAENLYDVSSGSPHLVSILPGGAVSPCGVQASNFAFGIPLQQTHWVAADGSLVFFTSRGTSCTGSSQLYVREIGAGQTKPVSGLPVSGKACGVSFLRSTPGAAFFWTQSRLTATDTDPVSCGGELDGDVYRYDLGDGSLVCVTCAVAGLDTNVLINLSAVDGGPAEVAVADDGSRVYFKTKTHLLSGAAKDGSYGAYRVNVATGDLAFVAPVNPDDSVGQTAAYANALSADGSIFLFRSSSLSLNAPGGQQNGSSAQYYRYDDRDRSLVCVSCPADGSPPAGAVDSTAEQGKVPVLVSADGDTVAFATPTPLAGADLNTAGVGQEPEAGVDAYEWRDGRPLLVSDGLGSWAKNGAPRISGISADGRDIFLLASTQYTPDALDGYQRLYDARIGGGFEFPKPPKPCPLEVCQGTPKGAPEEPPPGTGAFAGPGNVAKSAAACRKGKVRRKGRCVAKAPSRKHSPKRASHDRRGNR